MALYQVVLYEAGDETKPVADFLRHYKRVNPGVFKKCVQYIRALEEYGLGLPRSYLRHVSGPVWELRPEFGGVEYRLFIGSIGKGTFGVVSAYQKTWDRIPDRVIRLAAERIGEMGE